MNKYKKGAIGRKKYKVQSIYQIRENENFQKISLSQGLASIYINIKLFTSCCLDVLTKRFCEFILFKQDNNAQYKWAN